MSDNIAIIPARGGSKRILNKSIREFIDKPIICYAIAAAQLSKLYRQVIVSTDDKEIARVAKQCGAYVAELRPAKLADDYAPVTEVVKYEIEHNHFDNFDYVTCIFATAALLTADDLISAHKQLIKAKQNALLAVTENAITPQRSYVISQGGLELLMPEYKYTRSQDLPKTYRDAGSFWMYKISSLVHNDFFSNNMLPYILPNDHCQDIDDEHDWRIAENKYLKRQKHIVI